MYLKHLASKWDKMQPKFGDPEYNSIYGYGEIETPNLMLIFMNPTARNIGSHKNWKGIRAPWIGTKGVWKMLHDLELFNNSRLLKKVDEIKGNVWTTDLAKRIYQEIQNSSIYITNIAKCTLSNARAVKNSIYRKYLPTLLDEIDSIKPKHVISFGNQVSSILLDKGLSVANYSNTHHETIEIDKHIYKIYPTYYPMGQGRRNMPQAKARIKRILG
jgi:uracil-DNA glycosylase